MRLIKSFGALDSMELSQGRPALKIIRSEIDAKLLVDPMRREILRLVSRETLTESRLAQILGLSPPTVAHHLKPLKSRGFISIVRREAEKHGMIRKFYQTSAATHIIDKRHLPLYVKRYFMPLDIERARGLVAGLALLDGSGVSPSSAIIEKLAVTFGDAIAETAGRYEHLSSVEDPEELINGMYFESLRHLMKNDLSPLRVFSPKNG